MGGWKLEVFKMGLFISFPVMLFHYFNQPEYFEEWVTKTRRAVFPPDNQLHREEIEDCIRKMQEKRDTEMLNLLKQQENKK